MLIFHFPINELWKVLLFLLGRNIPMNTLHSECTVSGLIDGIYIYKYEKGKAKLFLHNFPSFVDGINWEESLKLQLIFITISEFLERWCKGIN